MSDGSEKAILEIGLSIVGGITSFIVYQWRRITGQVEKLSSEAVTRNEFNETIKSLRNDVQDGDKGIHHRLDELMQFLMKK